VAKKALTTTVIQVLHSQQKFIKNMNNTEYVRIKATDEMA